MQNSFFHIEQKLLELGKTILLKENQTISLVGDVCQFIVFLPQNTSLNFNNKTIQIEAGTYLNVKEFFTKEPFRNTIITLQKTKAVLIEIETFERKTESSHEFQLFFLKKLSQQAVKFHSVFE